MPCRNNNVGTDNGNRNGDGPNYVVSTIAYVGSGNNNGEQRLHATCLLYNISSIIRRPPELVGTELSQQYLPQLGFCSV